MAEATACLLQSTLDDIVNDLCDQATQVILQRAVHMRMDLSSNRYNSVTTSLMTRSRLRSSINSCVTHSMDSANKATLLNIQSPRAAADGIGSATGSIESAAQLFLLTEGCRLQT